MIAPRTPVRQRALRGRRWPSPPDCVRSQYQWPNTRPNDAKGTGPHPGDTARPITGDLCMPVSARPFRRAARCTLAGAALAALGVPALPSTAVQAATGSVVLSANVLSGIGTLTPTGTPNSKVLT